MRKKRITYRPNKAQAVLGGVMGGVFVLLGIFVVIPTFGLFGIFWTLIAAAITVINLYQGFGKKYVGPEIRIEDEESRAPSPAAGGYGDIGLSAEKRLEQLQRLLDSGLITREEYSAKREEILREL